MSNGISYFLITISFLITVVSIVFSILNIRDGSDPLPPDLQPLTASKITVTDNINGPRLLVNEDDSQLSSNVIETASIYNLKIIRDYITKTKSLKLQADTINMITPEITIQSDKFSFLSRDNNTIFNVMNNEFQSNNLVVNKSALEKTIGNVVNNGARFIYFSKSINTTEDLRYIITIQYNEFYKCITYKFNNEPTVNKIPSLFALITDVTAPNNTTWLNVKVSIIIDNTSFNNENISELNGLILEFLPFIDKVTNNVRFFYTVQCSLPYLIQGSLSSQLSKNPAFIVNQEFLTKGTNIVTIPNENIATSIMLENYNNGYGNFSFTFLYDINRKNSQNNTYVFIKVTNKNSFMKNGN